ncbi:MAG: hypothetical protein ACLGPL_11440 [Acidobacteriota bacterium]
MGNEEHQASAVVSWIVISGICLSVIAWGLFLYLAIGEREIPPWDYRIIEDVPGESPYSTSSPKQFPSPLPRALGRAGEGVVKQHISGPVGEYNKSDTHTGE